MAKAAQTKTKEARLKDLVFEMFTEEKVQIELLCPLNLVRVIPKESTSRGGIVLPDKHNKLLYEGIVLQTWVGKAREPYKEGNVVNVGDHVVFQHFVGIPCFDLLNKDQYRMIKDDDLQAVLHYEKEDVHEKIMNLFEDDGGLIERVIDKLLDEFDVIPKGQHPLTESGK